MRFPMMTMFLRAKTGRAFAGAAAFVACLALFCGDLAQAAQRKSRRNAKPAPASTPSASPLPLRVGEKLDYTAHFSRLSNVATIQLAVVERRDFFGKAAWHLQAVAHTVNPMRIVFELDDQFDSYSDAATLTGLQYEMHVNERGRREDGVLRLTSDNDSAPPNATALRAPGGTPHPPGVVGLP